MNRRRWLSVMVVGCSIAAGALVCHLQAWAAPPEGKGKDNAPGQEKKQDQENAGNGNSNAGGNGNSQAASAAVERASRAADRAANADAVRAERTHVHAERANDRAADQAADRSQATSARTEPVPGRPSVVGRDRQPDDTSRGQTHDAVMHLAKGLTALEHTRWSYNPHDTRGQGNMGKVDMRDPYGFDKDSGRTGADRGRVIRPEPSPEPALDLSLVQFSFDPTDTFEAYFQMLVDNYVAAADLYSGTAWYAPLVELYQGQVTMYQNLAYTSVAVDSPYYQPVQYSIDVGDVPTASIGDTLVITTTLTSVNTYTDGYWTYDTTLGKSVYTSLSYDPGELVTQQTQEITLTDSGSYAFSYDIPDDIVGYTRRGDFTLAVTVTDPVSGASYTTSYEEPLRIFRCPYGVVYDQATRQPITNAVVTVHDAATGAIIALDKGANPHQSNPQTTDATGRYDAKLQIGRQYYLTVQAPGYNEYQSPVFSERWHVVREDVALEKLQTVAQR